MLLDRDSIESIRQSRRIDHIDEWGPATQETIEPTHKLNGEGEIGENRRRKIL